MPRRLVRTGPAMRRPARGARRRALEDAIRELRRVRGFPHSYDQDLAVIRCIEAVTKLRDGDVEWLPEPRWPRR